MEAPPVVRKLLGQPPAPPEGAAPNVRGALEDAAGAAVELERTTEAHAPAKTIAYADFEREVLARCLPAPRHAVDEFGMTAVTVPLDAAPRTGEMPLLEVATFLDARDFGDKVRDARGRAARPRSNGTLLQVRRRGEQRASSLPR